MTTQICPTVVNSRLHKSANKFTKVDTNNFKSAQKKKIQFGKKLLTERAK